MTIGDGPTKEVSRRVFCAVEGKERVTGGPWHGSYCPYGDVLSDCKKTEVSRLMTKSQGGKSRLSGSVSFVGGSPTPG